MTRSWWQRIGYIVLRSFARLAGITVFQLRCLGRQHVPPEGGVLVCSNHQSYLDPVVVGMCFQRRLNYLARKTLFRFTLFRWLIEYLDAIPIDRDGMGVGGLKETLRRLKRGEMVLIFPEGTRTKDGQVGPLHPGFCAVARRGSVHVLPVGFDGAYQAWPRHARWPRRTRIAVVIGQPLSPEQIAKLDDEGLVAELHRRIVDCHQRAREMKKE